MNNELLAGYANYTSTEAILAEQMTAHGEQPLTGSFTVSAWTWTWSFCSCTV